jgi:hypothetical protein
MIGPWARREISVGLGELAGPDRILARLEHDFPRFGLEVLIREYPVTNPPALAVLRADAGRLGLPWPPATSP